MRNAAFTLALGLAVFIVSSVGSALAAGKRVALVVGNGAYEHTLKLRNPRNDAGDIAESLEKLGFEVLLATDQTKKQLEGTLVEFAGMLEGADTAVFFYAGHGLQASGRNYLVPIDAKLDSPLALEFELVRLRLVQQILEEKASANVIFLDACRDNPLARNLAQTMGTRSVSLVQGLAPAESGVGTLISFATQPGNVAVDGKGRNSPYSKALVRHIAKPNQDISSILVHVRNDVMAATGNKQVPWEHSALSKEIVFNKGSLTKQPAGAQQAIASAGDADPEKELWNLVKATDDRALLQEYISMFPRGQFIQTARKRLSALASESQSKVAASDKPAKPTVVPQQQVEQKHELAALPAAKGTTSPSIDVKANAAADAKVAATGQVAKADTGNLALDVQRELQRAQCYTGKLDGVWGSRSQNALRRALADGRGKAELSAETLDALRGLKAGHCRLAAVSPTKDQNAAKKSLRKRPTVGKRTRKKTTKTTKPRKVVTKTKRKQSNAGRSRGRAVARKKSKKNCKFQINPDSFTDEKAPKGIMVCN